MKHRSSFTTMMLFQLIANAQAVTTVGKSANADSWFSAPFEPINT